MGEDRIQIFSRKAAKNRKEEEKESNGVRLSQLVIPRLDRGIQGKTRQVFRIQGQCHHGRGCFDRPSRGLTRLPFG